MIEYTNCFIKIIKCIINFQFKLAYITFKLFNNNLKLEFSVIFLAKSIVQQNLVHYNVLSQTQIFVEYGFFDQYSMLCILFWQVNDQQQLF